MKWGVVFSKDISHFFLEIAAVFFRKLHNDTFHIFVPPLA